MKRHDFEKPLAYAVICLALLIGAVGTFQTNIEDAATNAPMTQTGKTPQAMPSDELQPTAWDPIASPDIYDIRGEAVIPDNGLAPGEVRYVYDPDAKSQSVYARLTYDNIEYGKRERESISDIDPIGWPEHNQRAHVSFADGTEYNGWFWNRSHLLGHALGGEDEEKNLVTGTRAQNVGSNDMKGGMLYIETMTRDYLESHRNGEVYYIVRPVYLDDEDIPRSVFVDVRTDDGSIDMRIEVHNVMPGYDIDYKTGEIHAK